MNLKSLLGKKGLSASNLKCSPGSGRELAGHLELSFDKQGLNVTVRLIHFAGYYVADSSFLVNWMGCKCDHAECWTVVVLFW